MFIDCINAYLLDAHAKGRHTVLIIDEAQNLSADVLEQMRLLTNLETNERKLLQIILLGQPELAAMLERPELRQLAQRIIARYHLGPLDRHEVAAYVRHRLEVAGAQRQLFPAALMGSLYRLSGGVPRIINVLCDRALLGTYSQGKERVDRATLEQAAREVFHNPAAQRRSLLRPLLAGLMLASTVFAVAHYQSAEQAAPPAKTEMKAMAINQPAALPDVLEWPAAQPIADSKSLAYAALFKAWGEEYPNNDGKKYDACKQAQSAGLRCTTARGWLDDLRRLNLPAVLQMHDTHGQEFSAALTGLDDKSATFVIGGESRKVALGVLAAQWSGHYTLLWRKPPVASKKLHLGDYGPDIKWLGKQLAQLDGKAAETGNTQLFDETMLRQVKQFQLGQGLNPDGRVGPQTLMRLIRRRMRQLPNYIRRKTKCLISWMRSKNPTSSGISAPRRPCSSRRQRCLREKGHHCSITDCLQCYCWSQESQSVCCVHGKRSKCLPSPNPSHKDRRL